MREPACVICRKLVTHGLQRPPRLPRSSVFPRTAVVAETVNTGRRLLASSAAPKPAERTLPTDRKRVKHGAAAKSFIASKKPLDIYIMREEGEAIMRSKNIPTELNILTFLSRCSQLGQALKAPIITSNARYTVPSQNAANALLSLVDNGDKAPSRDTVTEEKIDALSDMVLSVIAWPTVSISVEVLRAYTAVQLSLSSPDRIPYIMEQFASKPEPISATEFRESNPDKVSAAIPIDIAEATLQAAIQHKNLDLCLAIVEKTTATSAWRQRKLLTKALPVGVGVFGLMPLGLWALALQVGSWQNVMEASRLSGYAFAMFMTYTGSLTILGYITITTNNSHFKRITWIPGTPLWKRWAREDERAMIDRIAQAWGFASEQKWGDERGESWDMLKKWCTMRDMRLDWSTNLKGLDV